MGSKSSQSTVVVRCAIKTGFGLTLIFLSEHFFLSQIKKSFKVLDNLKYCKNMLFSFYPNVEFYRQSCIFQDRWKVFMHELGSLYLRDFNAFVYLTKIDFRAPRENRVFVIERG